MHGNIPCPLTREKEEDAARQPRYGAFHGNDLPSCSRARWIQLHHKNFTRRGVAIEIPSGMRPLFLLPPPPRRPEIFARSAPLVRSCTEKTLRSLPPFLESSSDGREGDRLERRRRRRGCGDGRENKNREAIIAPSRGASRRGATMGKMRRHARKRGLGFAVWPPQNRRRRREDWHRQDSAWRLAPRLRARYHLVVCQAPGVGGPRKFAEMQLLQSPSTNPQTSPPFATSSLFLVSGGSIQKP